VRLVLPNREKWDLTQEALDKLLARLDPDEEGAGHKYESIRRKLIKFFEFHGCAFPDDYADETINRVAGKIDGGTQIRASEPYLYFHGVARNVLRERWNETEKEMAALDSLSRIERPSEDPDELTARESERQKEDQKLECFHRCMQRLSPESRELIIGYHQGEKLEKIENRKKLAKRLEFNLNALRIRIHRIRADLEQCIDDCLRQSKAD